MTYNCYTIHNYTHIQYYTFNSKQQIQNVYFHHITNTTLCDKTNKSYIIIIVWLYTCLMT